jgi:hypothetical protein
MIDEFGYLKQASREFVTPYFSGTINPKFIILYHIPSPPSEVIPSFIKDDGTKESTHLVVGFDKVWQLAPFTAKTWHAGASYWQGHHGLNSSSIGIHVCDPFNANTPKVEEVLKSIIPYYNIRAIVPHKRPHTQYMDISAYRKLVEYGNADSIGRFVSLSNVEIMGGPNMSSAVLDTLSVGDAVKVLRYNHDGEWAFVLYERKDGVPRYGWTHESFLRRL